MLTPIDFTQKNAKDRIIQSCKEIGFAVIVNHPIKLDLINNSHAGWKNFFSSDAKNTYQFDQKTLDGYFPFGVENASTGKYRDMKEYYYFYPWGKCPDDLKYDTYHLHGGLFNLGSTLLEYLEEALPEAIKNQLSMPLKAMITNSPRAVLRILHYPPLSERSKYGFSQDADSGAVRAVEHEDLTLLSLIMQIDGAGLRLKDRANNWHNIEPGVDKLIVNIGDMLSLCTKGFYKATTHCVANPEGENTYNSRYSNAFFLNPRDEVQLDEQHTALSCMTKHMQKKLHQVLI